MNKLFDVSVSEKEGALAFSTDAFLLFAMLPEAKDKTACELGTGNGSVAMLAASRGKFAHVDAVEVQSGLIDSARENVRRNGLSDKVTVIGSDLRDLPSCMNGCYDAVFFNPPYLKNDSKNTNCDETNRACRHEIYGDISDFCKAAARLLKNGGDAYAVYRPERLADLICALRGSGLEPKRMTTVCPTEEDGPSLILMKAKKGARAGLICERPAYIYKTGTREYREEFLKIYESGVIK